MFNPAPQLTYAIAPPNQTTPPERREQIAILKSFGFSNRVIGGHYLKFALVIVLLGTALGILGGVMLGHSLVDMYHL